MPSGQFGRGMPAREFGRGVDAATLHSAQMVRGTLPVVPTRASLMPGNRMAGRSAIPARSINNTHFFSRNPVPARTESFNQRAAQIQQMVRQGPTNAANYGARGANTAERFGNAGAGGYGNTNRSGFGNSRPATPQGQSGNSGWQQFSSRAPNSQSGQARGYSNGGYGGMRPQSAPNERGYQGGGQGYPRSNQAAPSNRSGGWNAPAPRTTSPGWGQWSGGRSYGGYGGRPTLNMNRPIVVPRSNAPRSYSGGGRGEKGGGGGHSSGGGGGGHSTGGGGHSGGGGGHSGGGGGHHR
jgi:hypothetical protein